MKKVIVFWFLCVNLLTAQMLSSSAFVIDTVNFQSKFGEGGNYLGEADFDGNGKSEIIIFNRNDSLESIKIFDKNFSLLKSLYLPFPKNEFAVYYASKIKKGVKEDFFLPSVSEQSFNLKVISYSGNSIFYKTIYSLPKSKHQRCAFETLVVPHRYFIVAMNFLKPEKESYRRILIFSLDDYKLLKEIRTADYIKSFFYSKKFPYRFYYVTLSLGRNYFYSNGTFYYKNSNRSEYLIDISFVKNPASKPDPKARDYSDDFFTNIVSLNFAGQRLKRIKIGDRAERIKNISTADDSTEIILSYNGKSKLISLYYYDLQSNELKLLNEFSSKFYSIKLIGNEVFLEKNNIISKYRFSRSGLKFILKTDVARDNGTIIYLRKLKNRYFIFGNNILVTDSAFRFVAQMRNFGYWKFNFSKGLDCYVIMSGKRTMYFRFRKATLFERIPVSFWKYLLKIVSALLVITIILWSLTIYKSRKMISKQNKELLKKQDLIEKTTAQLIHSEKLALLGTIAASFAHQLNSPLGAIINSAERLASKSTDENIDLILRSGEYIKTLVSKFLYSSRPISSEEPVCTDFITVWDNWYSLFSREFLYHGIEIKTDFEENKCKIKMKSGELIEIISNIMFNARDSILESNEPEGQIIVSAKGGKDYCEFIFQDTGKGIPHEVANKIFEPFVSSKKEGRGTGLGMWIVKRIVDQYGGEILFENSQKGAIFKVKIPECIS